MLNKYLIAIPSYKRPKILKKKTLKVLLEQNIDPKKIIFFIPGSPTTNLLYVPFSNSFL